MCGIVGIFTAWTNGYTSNELDMFRDMLFVDTFRGWDSTGVFGVDNLGNVQIHKEATMGPLFVKTKEYESLRSEMFRSGRFLVGHNRWATRGSVNDNNAHPFNVNDKIVLVQNGTYKGSHKHLKDVEVDTEAIAHVIAEEDDITKALQRIDAAYALVWYNVEKKEMQIIRNSERPLYVAYTKPGAFVFASEAETILYAASRNKVELRDAPYMLKENNLATFSLTKDHWKEAHQEIDAAYKRPKGVYQGYQNTHQEHWKRHPFASAWENYENEYDDNVVPFTPTNTRHPFSDMNAPKNHIRVSVGEALLNYGGVDTYLTQEAVEMKKMFNGDKQVVVETVDYIHANDHRECSVFFIIAQIVTTDGNDFGPYVYWVQSEIEEVDALKISAGNLFKVTLADMQTRVINNEHKEERVLCYCPIQPGTREPIEVLETEDNVVQ